MKRSPVFQEENVFSEEKQREDFIPNPNSEKNLNIVKNQCEAQNSVSSSVQNVVHDSVPNMNERISKNTLSEDLSGKKEEPERKSITSRQKSWKRRFVENRRKWWGVFCIFFILVFPILFVRWLGLEQWQKEAFIFSVVLTVLFLHVGTFLLTVLAPLLTAFLLQALLDVPVYWTLPTLMIFGFSLCFRFSGHRTQMLHPGCKNCIFRIVFRALFHRD